ncbi:MAG: Asp-tRNA(Asn)/Glu-tRNA(Gln) amidotransferase subunit GatA [Anaerolineaceae bacterium]|nr:Asp-tRNA(Asn)/Glu-tRNA(Gln) amidotransferase subunit GatA [Anaerolineaceae bacterium]
MELCDNSAHQLNQMLRQREISAVEILESCLKRIEDVDGRPGQLDYETTPEDENKVHAFITLTDDRAREQAKEVDKKIANGEDPGRLAGIPFTVKDVFTVEDTPTTMASRILSNFVAPYTATAVKRMENAGALMLGKVNLDEFTFGSSSESSKFQPAPRNPWDLNRVPGGSSGGSVASVASGEAFLSLGTDTAGSIRQPASFSGTVGLKPTYGRVSRYGLIAAASSLDTTGTLARNITDTATTLQVIAGPDRHDATTASVEVPDYLSHLEEGVKGLRIGLSPDYFQVSIPNPETGEYDLQPIPDEIKQAVLDTAQVLSEMGAEIIEDVPMPHTRYGIPSYFVISRVEVASNLHRFDGVKYGFRTDQSVDELKEMYQKSRGDGFGVQPKLRILMGMYVSAAQYSEQYYQRALKVRTLIRQDFDQVYDSQGAYKLDALLTPTTPSTAFPIGDVYGDTVLMQYSDQLSVTCNHSGMPALSMPAGFDEQGLPIGVHLAGKDFAEETILRIGRAYEIGTQDQPWRQIKPQILRK